MLLLATCGKYGWEPIPEAETGPQHLNIFGVLAVDNLQSSFVVVHRTLPTSGPSFVRVRDPDSYYIEAIFDEDFNVIGWDTIYVYRDSSLYVVSDAEVIISDGVDSIVFEAREPRPNEDWWDPIMEGPGAYYPMTPFFPQPLTTYTLSVTAPDGLTATAQVTTPPYPVIKLDELPDTVSMRNTFEVSWQPQGDFPGDVTGGVRYDEDDINEEYDDWVCGTEQHNYFNQGDTTWSSIYPSWCIENEEFFNDEAAEEMEIRLRFFEDHFYQYLEVNDEGAIGITNFLLGEGNIGLSEGIVGGYGVFGAYSANRVNRIAVP